MGSWVLTFGYIILSFINSSMAGPGAEFIRKNIPELYLAVSEQIGGDRATEYFDRWSTRDMEIYRARLRPLFRQTRPDGELVDPNSLWDRYQPVAVSLFGEIEGNQRMRARAAEVSGTLYMDEALYEKVNGEVKRPDGMNYRIEGDRLVVTKILESKMGHSGYSYEQAKGYLDLWQGNGVMVYDRTGRRVPFGPGSIDVLVNGVPIPVRRVSVTNLRDLTLLMGTKAESGFKGEYQRCTFENETYTQIAREFVGNLASRRCNGALSQTYQSVLQHP